MGKEQKVRPFRLALAQVNPTVGDLEGNVEKVLSNVEKARSWDVDLIAFPELILTGYPPEDLLLRPGFVEDGIKALQAVVSKCKDIVVVLGFVDTEGTDLYNSAAIIWNGRIIGTYHKLFLPNYGVFDEERYFRRGNVCPVFSVGDTLVGVNICEDIWYALGPTAVQREAGAELIVTINGSPYHIGKRLLREQMLATRAVDNSVYIAFVNTVGGQDELVFDGGSTIFNQQGELIARSPQFQEDLLIKDLEIGEVLREGSRSARLRQETPEAMRSIGETQTIFVNELSKSTKSKIKASKISPALDPTPEIYRALVLGLRDYVRKNGFDKVLVGLSGGIDSSLTCCIAVDALGERAVRAVTMPSRYSSNGSVNDSERLCDNLGITLLNLPIETVHQAFEAILSPYFNGTEPNVAEQNIQARIRGNLLMALSNKFGWLLLNTGNKSEMAMGYATLYGDMAGGFSVLKDIPKTLVYELSYWRNTESKDGEIIPESVLNKPPSAELKPDQRDDDDLPSYDTLDQILEAYVENDRSFEEMKTLGFDPDLVQRVMKGVDKSEYKRRQSPLGIKITARAFGRDRRMPIVNAYRGF
jgi:NAD+ synthase (glutamine-hydrolysing)